MNEKQIRYVLALAREGSFSKAAEALNITQPSLSQYIKKIEQEIGMELFDRTGSDVRATDAGKAYIAIGRKILDLEHQLEGHLSDLASFVSGTITIGISPHRSVALIPPVVVAFKEMYPGITLKIAELHRNELLDGAEHGEFDLVITTLPVDTNLFTYEMIFMEENIVATKESLPSEIDKDRKYPVVPASALSGRAFVMLDEAHLMQRELNKLIQAHDLRLKKSVECTSLEAMVEMVKVGMGAAFIPACLARDPSLHYYSIKENVPKREIVVMVRNGRYLSKAVQDLKQLIRKTLA
jgi:DNA-binding transcriptional LysR family regulator